MIIIYLTAFTQREVLKIIPKLRVYGLKNFHNNIFFMCTLFGHYKDIIITMYIFIITPKRPLGRDWERERRRLDYVAAWRPAYQNRSVQRRRQGGNVAFRAWPLLDRMRLVYTCVRRGFTSPPQTCLIIYTHTHIHIYTHTYDCRIEWTCICVPTDTVRGQDKLNFRTGHESERSDRETRRCSE